MILFRPEHVEPILAGRKTQTRRIGKRSRCKVGSIHLAKTKMLSKDSFARLMIRAVYLEVLGAISDEDAKAEGYADKEAYFAAFFMINKIALADQDSWLLMPVHVVRFEVVL